VAGQPLGEREDLTHCRSSRSIRPTRATMTMRSGRRPTTIRPIPAAGRRSSRSPTSASTSGPGSALDKEARKRGNSVYFPDRVVPMLPETLSAEICSLKQGEDRAALACHLQVSKDGQLKSWRFTRARVRIAANIAYEDAQAAIDATREEEPVELAMIRRSLLDARDRASAPPVRPSWSIDRAEAALGLLARALCGARERAPLELDLPERRVVLDEKGRILSVAPRERLDAHKLIEDYMIAANVAAAKALEAKKAPVMYRDHEPPSREKLVALKDYLKTFEVEFALGQVVRPATFNHIIERIGEADFKPQVMEQILRTQTQAYYARTITAISASRWAPTPISPARSAAMPTSRPPLPGPRLLGPACADRPDRRRGRGDGGDRRADLAARAAGDGGRARHDRPLCRRLSFRAGRRAGRLPDHRRPAVRLLRHGRGPGRRRAGAGLDLGSDYFRYDEASQTWSATTAARASHGQRLSGSSSAASLRGQSGQRRPLRFELPETVTADLALDSARKAEEEIRAGDYRGPLHGVPIAVKDLIDVAGVATRCGSPMRGDSIAAEDAEVVGRLREAGAVILGKLALAEYALSGYHPDEPVPVNPWSADRWPGASSSGSGVAVAAGLCFAALGTDTGGSIRFPAAANGVTGLKPTYGTVSVAGVFGLAPSLDHVGPLARSAGDAAIVLAAIRSGFTPPAAEGAGAVLEGLRIGVDPGYNAGVEPAVAAGLDAALKVLVDAGAKLIEVELAPIREGADLWMAVTALEALDVHRATWPARADEYGPSFRALLDFAAICPREVRQQGKEARIRIRSALDRAFGDADLIACPSMIGLPPPVSVFSAQAVLPPEAIAAVLAFTAPFNFAGNPAIAFPCGLSAEGLPLSAQLVAPYDGEALLVRAVRAYEQLAEPLGQPPGF
jgi:Asp-tRNA(Asn)/Glu-tRNA(Gln) amidotransferase A subunit family amidase